VSTVAVYNGFGKYETRDNEKGIVLKYAGVDFWFPYKKVTYLPDYTFREVDHDKSTALEGEEGVLTYKSFRISGERLAEEILETQIPITNKEKGIIKIDASKRTGKFINVYAGMTEEGARQTAEVAEVQVSESDAQLAERLARTYKENIIQEYFQSKRERMAGGQGRLTPQGLVKVYMEELGVRDIDALPSSQSSNSNLEQLLTQVLMKGAQTAPAAVLEAAKATGQQKPKGANDLV
jgi:hypothetical protein